MYLTKRFFLLFAAIIVVVAVGYWLRPLYLVGQWLVGLMAVMTVADVGLLCYWRHSLTAQRSCASRFSNGDANRVVLTIKSTYGVPLWVEVVDEIPAIFQRRDVSYRVTISAQGEASLTYQLTPTVRGCYDFGHIRLFAQTRLGLVQRRHTCGQPQVVKVYPSYLMLRHYELMAMSHRLTELGVKRVRRVGHNTDFEQIKDYVAGDDYRTINWRATARRHQLMVNVYQEERSQQVFSIIDKGRMMQQAFGGMSLLDYAINAALVLSYVAVRKEDKAGLLTFSHEPGTFVPASRQPGHMQALQEALYAEQTQFSESDFSALAVAIGQHISRRSLLVIYTSFVGMTSLRRQMSYLRQIALRHRLLVVFFADEEQEAFMVTRPLTVDDYYERVIAQKFSYEQRLMVQTLRQYGIQALLTTPRQLSVGVINKYLEMKTT